jgi:hypothetical protein
MSNSVFVIGCIISVSAIIGGILLMLSAFGY